MQTQKGRKAIFEIDDASCLQRGRLPVLFSVNGERLEPEILVKRVHSDHYPLPHAFAWYLEEGQYWLLASSEWANLTRVIIESDNIKKKVAIAHIDKGSLSADERDRVKDNLSREREIPLNVRRAILALYPLSKKGRRCSTFL